MSKARDLANFSAATGVVDADIGVNVQAYDATILVDADIGITVASTAANTFTGLQTDAASADIASATTLDLTAATGNTVVITGTTTTTGFTMVDGQQMILLPSGAWPITFHATTANINGGVSYTCAAGDRVYVVRDLADVIRVSVIKQDGTSVVAPAGVNVTPINANIALLAFQLQVLGSLTIQKMTDGVVDEYEDQLGVNDPNNTEFSYNGTLDMYSATIGASYGAQGSVGNRTASITVSTDLILTAGTINNLIDGVNASNSSGGVHFTYDGSIAGNYIRFDFGASYSPVMTEARLIVINAETATRGFWKWQGSTDATTWVDVSVSTQLGGAPSWTQPFTNSTAYRYYQMVGVSGGVDNASGDRFWNEMEFKIVGAASGVLLSDPSTAYTTPTAASIVMWQEDVDSVTLNTDLFMFVSRETGVAFTTNFATNNKLTSTAHGFLNGQRVMITSSAQNLPAGSLRSIVYFVVNQTTDNFEVSLTSGGAAVVLTGNGTGTHTVRRWAQVTLTEHMSYTTGRILLGNASLTAQTSGVAMRYAVVSTNSKNSNIHAVALQWS